MARVTIDRHGRVGRTSASSSVLSTLTEPRNEHDLMHLPLSRSRHSVDFGREGNRRLRRHSVDCSASAQRQAAAATTSRSTSRLHLGVPSDLRRSSLQTDRGGRGSTSACDGGTGGCTAQSSGSRSSVVTVDEATVAGTRRVSYGGVGAAPSRSAASAAAAAPRDTTIFDIGADLIKVSTTYTYLELAVLPVHAHPLALDAQFTPVTVRKCGTTET